MKHGDLIGGFPYLIMLCLARHDGAGVGLVRNELKEATGEEFTLGGISATLKTLADNDQVHRTREPAKAGERRLIYRYRLTIGGTGRLAAMNSAVRALLPAEIETA